MIKRTGSTRIVNVEVFQCVHCLEEFERESDSDVPELSLCFGKESPNGEHKWNLVEWSTASHR